MTQSLPFDRDSAGVEQTTTVDNSRALCDWVRREFAEPRLSQTLDAASDLVSDRHWRSALSGPLLELLARDGKCFRSRLVEAAFDLGAGGARQMPTELPLIVEALHTGSLIVDDIQDDSASRRGKRALHLLVGVPLALNAGNWLYFLPHRLLEDLRFEPGVELALRRAIDRSVLRCHYGQALDLGVRLAALSQAEVFDVVTLSTRLKTGSLLELAAEVGAIAGGAPRGLQAALANFGRRYGIALQMLDDLSGLYEPKRAQKGLEDLRNGGPTWPWAWLSQRLDEITFSRLQRQSEAVVAGELAPDGLAAQLRQKLGDAPQRPVQQELASAFAALSAEVSDRRLLEPLRNEIERLEVSYG